MMKNQCSFQCSFCGGCEGDDVLGGRPIKKIVAGPTVYICDQCVALCQEVIDEQAPEQAVDEKAPEKAPEKVPEQPPPPAEQPTSSRIESGVVQFGDDWPGVFLRGDDALGYGMRVHEATRSGVGGLAPDLGELATILLSCEQSPNLKPRRLHVVEQPTPVADPTVAHIVERLERAAADLRKAGKTSLAVGYVLRDLAVDCGYKEPQPGLDPRELKAVVRLARSAPSDDVAAHIESLRKDLEAWEKATRSSSGYGALLGVLGLGAVSAWMASKAFGGEK